LAAEVLLSVTTLWTGEIASRSRRATGAV